MIVVGKTDDCHALNDCYADYSSRYKNRSLTVVDLFYVYHPTAEEDAVLAVLFFPSTFLVSIRQDIFKFLITVTALQERDMGLRTWDFR